MDIYPKTILIKFIAKNVLLSVMAVQETWIVAKDVLKECSKMELLVEINVQKEKSIINIP
jgi:hypothetical protein